MKALACCGQGLGAFSFAGPHALAVFPYVTPALRTSHPATQRCSMNHTVTRMVTNLLLMEEYHRESAAGGRMAFRIIVIVCAAEVLGNGNPEHGVPVGKESTEARRRTDRPSDAFSQSMCT